MKGKILLLLLLLPCAIHAQNIYSNEFLNIGAGARGLAMANSVDASVDDITAMYYNPAGLAAMTENVELDFMHADYFAGVLNYDFGGIAFKSGPSSYFGVSLVRFGADNIPNTFQLIDPNGQVDYSQVTAFSAADYALFVTFAKNVTFGRYRYHGHRKFRFGGNMKIIRRVVGTFGSSWGFGFDAGMQFEQDKWGFSLVAKDLTTTYNAWTYTYNQQQKQVLASLGSEVPVSSVEITQPSLRGSIKRTFDLSENLSLLVEAGADATFDGRENVPIATNYFSIDPHGGFEFGYKKVVFLRGGVGNFQTYTNNDVSQKVVVGFSPSVGAGVVFGRFVIDYAFTNISSGQEAGTYSNIISVKYKFEKEKKR